jgi:hypothetical protein
MMRMLALGWLDRRLRRTIPNPLLRTAAVAGAGLLLTRMMRGRLRPRAA